MPNIIESFFRAVRMHKLVYEALTPGGGVSELMDGRGCAILVPKNLIFT